MVNTTTDIGPEVDKYWDNVLIDRDKSFYSHLLFGQVRRIPAKNSSVLTGRKYDNLDDTPVSLVEGVTPALDSVSKNDVDVELQQFGKAVGISDRVNFEVQDETAEEIADMLSQNMFGMLDKVTRNTLQSTSTIFDSVNGNNGNSITEFNEDDFEEVLDHIFGNKGLFMTPQIDATTGIGTSPIDASFWGIIHTDTRKDLEALASYERRSKYSESRGSLQNEIGATDYVRWVQTTEAYVDRSSSPAVYSNFVFAQNAYLVADINEVATEMIIKPLGSGEDPLNQRQVSGWKAMFGAGIIDDGKMANFRTTRST